MRTQVAIVGAGPAGMFLAHLLHRAGVDAVVFERRDRAYVEGRVRAGVLERGTVALMEGLGVADRLHREGLVHEGTQLVCDHLRFRIDLRTLTSGSTVSVYGQQEVMRDLFDAAVDRGLRIVFDAEDLELHELSSERPYLTWREAGVARRMDFDFVAGCDGQHGAARRCVPEGAFTTFERIYPFGWLGVLVEAPPCSDELIYANHPNGFALASMRSPSRSRYYIQCAIDERIEDWPDARFWDEAALRLGPEAAQGMIREASFEKSIAPLRSSVTEPMRYGRLLLAGDAAHIVPPTGAKGLNLAVSDVVMMAEALRAFYIDSTRERLDGYSALALARVWKAERFSWWFTSLMHQFPGSGPFDQRLQVAELEYLEGSRAAQASFAENYVGLSRGLPGAESSSSPSQAGCRT